MMSTAANAKSFAELLNSYNQQQQIAQQQQHMQAQKALLEAHNENSQSSDVGRKADDKLSQKKSTSMEDCLVSEHGSGNNSGGEGDSRRRKKKSRWAGGDHDKTFIPGMPTILPPGMSQDQQEAYLGECAERPRGCLFRFRLGFFERSSKTTQQQQPDPDGHQARAFQL